MKSIDFILCVLVSLLLLSCSPEENQSLDQEATPQDSLRVADFMKRWRVAYYKGPDSIKAVADELIAFAQEKGNRPALVSGNNMLAVYHSKKGDDETALKIYKANLETNQGDLKGLAKIHNNIGNAYLRKGDYDLALDAQIKGLKAEEELGNKEGMATSYLNIAGIYAHLVEFDEVITYAEKAYTLAEEGKFDRVKMQVAYQLAEVFVKQEKDSLALVYSDTTMSCAKRLASEFGVHKAKAIRTTVYRHQARIVEALKVTREINEFYKRNKIESEYLNSRIIEAELLFKLGRYALAESVGLENIKMALKLQEKEQIAKIYKNLSITQERLNKIEEAHSNYKRFHSYQDSIINIEKNKAIQDMATKYETGKKEAAIAALSQQATIQELEIKQKNIAIAVGLILLLVVLAGVYLFFRQRTLKGDQARMELEQRFLLSQLNPHFISNALLAVQNFMLKNQPEEAAVYLSKFSKLMRETLENSRREFILLEDELQMLTNFMDIHKMRMNDAFTYNIHLSERIDAESDTIPPMFIQPFIENAIEHGIPQAEGKGQIDLYFEKEGNYISVVIKDNGGGYSQKITKSKGHKSLSTIIVQERIDIFNKALKNEIKLLMAEVKNENDRIDGTKIELRVPLG